MNTAFDLKVRCHCPNARVVYDLLYVIAKYGREVISRVRVDAANQLRHGKPAHRVVKQAHCLLLCNPAHLKTSAQHIRLDGVVAANQSLMMVYVMIEPLKALWTAPNALGVAAPRTSGRLRAAEWDPRADALRQVSAWLLARHPEPGALAHAYRKLGGINTKIKVLKHMAYRLPRQRLLSS